MELFILIGLIVGFLVGWYLGHSVGQLSGAKKAAILFKPEKTDK